MSYNFACNWQDAILNNSSTPQQIGYLTEFNGLGLPAALAQDLAVQCPFNNATGPQYQGLGFTVPLNQTLLAGSIVAALQSVSWGGGVNDVFSFSCYMSQQNAVLLKSLQQQTLPTLNISSIGWWITNYAVQPKLWFEELYPKSPANPSAKLNVVGNDVYLDVDLIGVKVGSNTLYQVRFEIAPSPNMSVIIHTASSPTQQIDRAWGPGH